MPLLTVLLTHLDAERVQRQLAYMGDVAPESRFSVCHSGLRADFERLETDDAFFLEDPQWTGANREQGYVALLRALWEQRVRGDATVELVYLLEYDHLVLSAEFERRLVEVAERSGAGLVGKWASARNDTNWPHLARFRHDEGLNRYIERITVRDDPSRRWGCLGAGMLLRRDALEAYCAVAELPHVYGELHVPTVVWHLGFDIADFDAYGDLYAAVRWRPEYSVADAIAAKRAGRALVHPFKELDRLDEIRAA